MQKRLPSIALPKSCTCTHTHPFHFMIRRQDKVVTEVCLCPRFEFPHCDMGERMLLEKNEGDGLGGL